MQHTHKYMYVELVKWAHVKGSKATESDVNLTSFYLV